MTVTIRQRAMSAWRLAEAARAAVRRRRTTLWTTPASMLGLPGDGGGPYQFPEGFLWGTAVAAQHVEDQQPSDWTAFERDAALHGRTGTGDKPGHPRPGHIHHHDRYSDEVRQRKTNFDRMYEADLDRVKGWGHSAFRFSISWSRMFPRENMSQPDPEAVAYYRRLLDAMNKRGLSPFVTLFHFESPAWFWLPEAGRRGWERPDAVERFAQFVRAVVEHFGGDIEYWCTLNEPMVYLYNGYLDGVFPPLERRSGPDALEDVMVALLKAHAVAYRLIKEDGRRRGTSPQVGLTMHTRAFEPYRDWNPLDRLAAEVVGRAFIWDFLQSLMTGRLRISAAAMDRPVPEVVGTQDYVGINYYGRFLVQAEPRNLGKPTVHYHDPGGADDMVNDLGWECYPHGFYLVLCEAHRRLGLPIYILENGTADGEDDDRRRQRFLVTHVREMWNAIRSGVDIRGYFHWSLMDNFEWAEGFNARFGLMAVAYEDGFRRVPRPSAEIYAEIVRGNALSDELWQRLGPRPR